MKGHKFLQIEDVNDSQKEKMIFFFSLSMSWYNHSFVLICLLIGTISQVSDVAHGRLVLLNVVSFFTGIFKESISFAFINPNCMHNLKMQENRLQLKKFLIC